MILCANFELILLRNAPAMTLAINALRRSLADCSLGQFMTDFCAPKKYINTLNHTGIYIRSIQHHRRRHRTPTHHYPQ